MHFNDHDCYVGIQVSNIYVQNGFLIPKTVCKNIFEGFLYIHTKKEYFIVCLFIIIFFYNVCTVLRKLTSKVFHCIQFY